MPSNTHHRQPIPSLDSHDGDSSPPCAALWPGEAAGPRNRRVGCKRLCRRWRTTAAERVLGETMTLARTWELTRVAAHSGLLAGLPQSSNLGAGPPHTSPAAARVVPGSEEPLCTRRPSTASNPQINFHRQNAHRRPSMRARRVWRGSPCARGRSIAGRRSKATSLR